LDQERALPKTILYNSNPSDFYPFGAMIGCFQDGSSSGKMQLGPGWSFLDSRERIECQLDALSHMDLLNRFAGMLTDARSFLSSPRHEYFCRLLYKPDGRDVDAGLIPADHDRLTELIRAICCENAKKYERTNYLMGFPSNLIRLNDGS
jgi:glucuronate isomerase